MDVFERALREYLPEASLVFQAVPDCEGLELLLIQPDFNDALLTYEQIEHLSDDPPYWIFCWASGRALAHRILSGDLDVRDKVIADFGAGSGVVALAAKRAGAKRVYACDIDARCQQLTQANAEQNHLELIIVDRLDAIEEPIDMVLAADVLYEQENMVFLDWMLDVSDLVVVADSRLKVMGDARFEQFATHWTTSFPDYGEAKANNEVRFYRNKPERVT